MLTNLKLCQEPDATGFNSNAVKLISHDTNIKLIS